MFKTRHRDKPNDTLKAILFLSPALFFIGVFFLFPLVRVFYMSFFRWPLLGTPTPLGLENYYNLLDDPEFIEAFWFTIVYTFWVTIPLFVLAFILAVMVNQSVKGVTVFRSIYFLPVVMSFVATSLIWLWLYHDLYGIINYFLAKIGIIDEPIAWMADKEYSLPAVCLSVIWKMTGFTMVILLAGMQSIPDEYYEASKTSGARSWHHIFFITLPLLRSSFALSLILSITGSILAFDQFMIMTKGGPANETQTLMMYIYNVSFSYARLGSGAAIAIVVMLLLIGLTIIQLTVLRKKTT